MSIFRTATGQTGRDAYRYELAAIGNSYRELQARFAKLAQTIAAELPNDATGNQSIASDRFPDATMLCDAATYRRQLPMLETLDQFNLEGLRELLASLDPYSPVDPAAGSPLCVACGLETDGFASLPTVGGRVHRACTDTGRWHGPEGPHGARRIELPYSEVCMHMRVAGKRMWAQGADGPLYGGIAIAARMVQLYSNDGRRFSAPITRGEAGL